MAKKTTQHDSLLKQIETAILEVDAQLVSLFEQLKQFDKDKEQTDKMFADDEKKRKTQFKKGTEQRDNLFYSDKRNVEAQISNLERELREKSTGCLFVLLSLFNNPHADLEKRINNEKYRLNNLESGYQNQCRIATDNHNESQRIAEENLQRKQVELSKKRQKLVSDFQKNWNKYLLPLDDVCQEIRRAQPLLYEINEKHLTSAISPQVLAFGRLRLAIPKNDELKEWRGFVPRLLQFPFRKPLFGKYEKDNDRIQQLLLRLLFTFPTGMLQLTAIDPLKMGTSLAMFRPLLSIEKLVPAGKFLTLSDEMEETLREHYRYIEDCLQRRFRNNINNWAQYNSENKEHPLPYKVLFIFGFPEQFSDKSILYLKRILEHGTRCGVLPIITINEKQIDHKRAAGEIPKLLQNSGSKINNDYALQLKQLTITTEEEPFPTPQQLSQYLQWIHSAYEKKTLDIDVLWNPQHFWMEKSVDGISVPIGKLDDGTEILLELGGVSTEHHVLLAGRSGSGKSNLLHVIIHGLAHRYSSAELDIYLLDYKQATEFNMYANPPLPHARLVSTECDAEYGITILEHLDSELKRRADTFKKNGYTDFRECRNKISEPLPRVLLIIDEFQILLQTSDVVTKKASELFNNLLRQGRAFGIHVLLATQTLKGLQSITSIGQLTSQIGCRIVLACSQEDSALILGASNIAAAELKSPPEGIINNQSGQRSGNIRFEIPFAKKETCIEHQKFLAKQKIKTLKETKVFSGSHLPQLPLPQLFASSQSNTGLPIILGEELNFSSATFSFGWEQNIGNNLCIAGFDKAIHNGLLHSLLLSVDGRFERIIYFNTDPHFETLDLSVKNIEVQRSDWDGNIADIVSNFREKKTLLIVDSLENARVFQPKPATFGAKKTENTSADLFKQFLEDAPQYGSYVVAFAENWKRFEKQCKDYLSSFELRIGFNLDENDAGSLISGSITRFKGLDNCNKAVFVDRQRNRQVLFRPFISPNNE
jgi:energy-coupling factor transporter ATP-binding protein EcfA2